MFTAPRPSAWLDVLYRRPLQSQTHTYPLNRPRRVWRPPGARVRSIGGSISQIWAAHAVSRVEGCSGARRLAEFLKATELSILLLVLLMQSITEAEQRLRARAAALAKLKRQELQAKLHPKPCSALTKQGKPCARRALAPFRETT